MRRTVSLPAAGKKKPAGGGNNKEDQKASCTASLASYKDFQTGHDLTTGGYKVGPHIAAGADGDVFRGVSLQARGGTNEIAAKRIKISSAAILRHVVQEITSVFHARKKYAEEVDDQDCFGHPCIVGYFDWFAGQGGLEREAWITMELCNFGIGDLIYQGNVLRTEYEKMHKSHVSLEQLKAGSKSKSATSSLDPKLYRFPEREIVKVFFQMLSALSFLNRHGIFHRDVKSENILWRVGEPEGTYKLADFGVAFCEADADPSKRHDDCGTLWTMAPELLGRRIGGVTPGFNCDTWSLACVLFEMASFEKPFNSMDLLAYRNAGAESSDGFWASLLGTAPVKGSGPSSPSARWGAPPSLSNASTPKSGAASPCLGRPPRMTRQASLPALASNGNKSESPSASSSPSSPVGRRSTPASPSGGKHGRLMFSRSRTIESNSAPCPPALSRQNTGEEEPPSPAADPLRSRKRTFLRKRSTLKWIYSEGLRGLVCEDMLDEDASSRPVPADLLGCAKFHDLLASSNAGAWEPVEDVGRCAATAAAKIGVPLITDTAGAEESGPSEVVAVSEAAGESGASAAISAAEPATQLDSATAAPTPAPVPPSSSSKGNSLRQLTPEALLSVLKTNRKFDAAVFSHDNFEHPAEPSDTMLT